MRVFAAHITEHKECMQIVTAVLLHVKQSILSTCFMLTKSLRFTAHVQISVNHCVTAGLDYAAQQHGPD
jgi:hypothetical protein